MMAHTCPAYHDEFWRACAPDPVLTLSEWADEYRILPREAAAEPGPWSTSRTPYLKEIMDCLSPYSGVEEVVFKKPAQVGGTEVGINFIGFIVHLVPANVLVVQPTIEIARDKFSKQRLAPTIAATPVLDDRISDRKTRDSGNTLMMKEFPGGSLILTGANSAAGLRAMPVRFLILDEVDAYPDDVGGEGDPVLLAKERTNTYSNRKIFQLSTPTEAGVSTIEEAWESSDKRRYHIPCPKCRKMQVLEWQHVRFEHSDDFHLTGPVTYQCVYCGKLIEEHHKSWMLERGQWIPESPGEGKAAGFHLNALYSPLGWKSWRKIVEDNLRAKRDNDPQKLKVWVNTSLGEVWEPESEKVEMDQLESKVSRYGPLVPANACLLTAAVDVQYDRLEYEVLAWGPGLESWGMEHGAIDGDPRQGQVWASLDALLQKPWRHTGGIDLRIRRIFVDSGYLASYVYNFVRSRRGTGYFAIKGHESGDMKDDLFTRSKVRGRKVRGKWTGGLDLFIVKTNVVKDVLFAWLTTDVHGPGYCHFPEGFGYDEEYFKQLTAEHLVKKGKRYVWEKRRPGLRNEALDLRVYNVAAVHALASDPYRLVDAEMARLQRRIAETRQDRDPDGEPPPEPKRKARRRDRGGFVKNW